MVSDADWRKPYKCRGCGREYDHSQDYCERCHTAAVVPQHEYQSWKPRRQTWWRLADTDTQE